MELEYPACGLPFNATLSGAVQTVPTQLLTLSSYIDMLVINRE